MRQKTRLRVSITRVSPDGLRRTSYNFLSDQEDGTLDGALRTAQAEVVEQEVFAALIREASSLPTASAEVSERLIIIDAAQGTELRFELVGPVLAIHKNPSDLNFARRTPKIFVTTTGKLTLIATSCTLCFTSCYRARTESRKTTA